MTAILKSGARRGLYASAVVLALPLSVKIGQFIGAVLFGHHGEFWLGSR